MDSFPSMNPLKKLTNSHSKNTIRTEGDNPGVRQPRTHEKKKKIVKGGGIGIASEQNMWELPPIENPFLKKKKKFRKKKPIPEPIEPQIGYRPSEGGNLNDLAA